MRLYIDSNTIHAGRATREPINHARVAAILVEQGRHPILSRILAWGGKLDATDAERFGEELGLFEKGQGR